jgi:hypothetical protein
LCPLASKTSSCSASTRCLTLTRFYLLLVKTLSCFSTSSSSLRKFGATSNGHLKASRKTSSLSGTPPNVKWTKNDKPSKAFAST